MSVQIHLLLHLLVRIRSHLAHMFLWLSIGWLGPMTWQLSIQNLSCSVLTQPSLQVFIILERSWGAESGLPATAGLGRGHVLLYCSFEYPGRGLREGQLYKALTNDWSRHVSFGSGTFNMQQWASDPDYALGESNTCTASRQGCQRHFMNRPSWWGCLISNSGDASFQVLAYGTCTEMKLACSCRPCISQRASDVWYKCEC